MELLLDTHILLWAAGQPEKLSESTRTLLISSENSLFFSAASILEVVIKLGLGREDFKVDPYRLRKMLVVHGYTELPVTAEHALTVNSLPLLHKDPFDRLLLAQARVEGMALVTCDAAVSQYQESVLAVYEIPGNSGNTLLNAFIGFRTAAETGIDKMTKNQSSKPLMSPKIDFVFKLIFGDSKHKEITIAFLSAVLNLPAGVLADIEIINSELLREYKEDKKGILDVRVKTQDGRQINIEIQILPTEFMPERTLFYWSKMFTSQIQSGDGYELLKKAHVVFQGLIPGKRW